MADSVAVDPDATWLAVAEGGVHDIRQRGTVTTQFRAMKARMDSELGLDSPGSN